MLRYSSVAGVVIMSSIARWSYKNKATVWPYLGGGGTGGWGGDNYGDPYVIDCTYAGGGDVMSSTGGREFVPKMRIWHEDKRVKDGDLIAIGASADRDDASEILAHTEYDMSPFDETDSPDFMSVI